LVASRQSFDSLWEASNPSRSDNMDYQSSEQVLAEIVSIFPEFEAEWIDDNPYITNGSFSVHSVWLTLLDFLPSVDATPDQLSQVAATINEAVQAGGDSENAVSTCFLEHVYQKKGLGPRIKPLLSKETKERLRR
jgi:hypothetical protein